MIDLLAQSIPLGKFYRSLKPNVTNIHFSVSESEWGQVVAFCKDAPHWLSLSLLLFIILFLNFTFLVLLFGHWTKSFMHKYFPLCCFCQLEVAWHYLLDSVLQHVSSNEDTVLFKICSVQVPLVQVRLKVTFLSLFPWIVVVDVFVTTVLLTLYCMFRYFTV